MDKNQTKDVIARSGCFDADWYLAQYADVLAPGVDPLHDYLTQGFKGGRNPNPFFDASFYRQQVPDLPAESEPLLHFCTHGWRTFLDPGPGFSCWWYCVQHFTEGLPEQNPLGHFLSLGKDQGLSVLPPQGRVLSVEEKASFNTRSIALFQALPMSAMLASSLANSLERLGHLDLADMFLGKACALAPQNPAWLARSARVLRQRGEWGRMLLAIDRALKLDDSEAEWWSLAALANERLGRYDLAADAWRQAIARAPGDADWHYRLGRCEAEQGNLPMAERAYRQALERSSQAGIPIGLGTLHERDGAWELAAQAYAEQLEREPGAELHYRLGYVLECDYRWEEAQSAMHDALALDGGNADAAFRLGTLLERLERPVEAARAYAQAIESGSPIVLDCYYRLGLALYQAGEHSGACVAWLQALAEPPIELADLTELEEQLAKDRQDPELLSRFAQALEVAGELERAAGVYAEVALRRNVHVAADYYRLGRVLVRLGRHAEACVAFRDLREFKRLPPPVGTATPVQLQQRYAEYLATLDVRPDMVLYESFHGASVSCNPYALFRYLLEQPEHAGLLHVWAVRSMERIPKKYQALPNVVFVLWGSDAYLRYLATARYLVNNNTFMPYFIRRREQKYLNTWHGTPLKTLGRDMHSGPFEHKNVVRNLMQVTHLIHPNEHTREVLLGSYQARDLYQGLSLGSGYPRIDLMLGADQARRARLRTLLGIDNDLPVLLYAPTWRGSVSAPCIDTQGLQADLQALLVHPLNVVFSGHHMIKDKLDCQALGVFVLESEVDTTEFLAVVDVLVTDYSSVLFDYLPLRRPIILYAHDLESYRAERGLYFGLEELPAQICHSREELCPALTEALAGDNVDTTAFDAAIARFCPWEDGNACARVADFLLEDSAGVAWSSGVGKRWLFHGGPFVPNGITSSFLRLVSQLDRQSCSISLAVDPWMLESYPQRLQRFEELNSDVQVLGRISQPVASAEEQWLDQEFQRKGGRVNSHAKQLLVGMYQREFRRLYGDTRFDAVVDFGGYAYFWSALFALGRPQGMRGLLWMHNDMLSERTGKFPTLQGTFVLLEHFERIVSVSAGINRVNRDNLAQAFGVPAERFVSAPNLIDPAHLQRAAEAPLDPAIEAWSRGKLLIGSVARLSWEKGLDRLIEAFARFATESPEARLVIAGQGPQQSELNLLIKELGLEERVRLVGYQENPYPLMRRLDLFVLPSRYEGQGIVLLEALVLGRAVLATDIPGAHEVLQGTRGVLVESSVEGLYRGLHTFMDRGFGNQAFNESQYIAEALGAFHSALECEVSVLPQTVNANL